MEEQFNREAKEGWIFAADAGESSEDSNLGTEVGEREGAVASIPGNEGRITQAWVNVRGCTSGSRKDGPRGMKPCLRQF